MTSPILTKVHVNVPFCMLNESYLGFVLENRINPEIGLDAAALDSVEDSVFRKCAEALCENGASVSFHAPFVDLVSGSADSEIRAVAHRRYEQVLRLVPLFRPKTVVCHTGYEEFRHGYMKPQWTQNSLALWRWFSEELNSLGSRLVLENVFEKTPKDFLPLFESLAPLDVGFCLDVGHQSAFSRSSMEEWLEVLGPFLRQLHLHDNHGDHDSHLPMGRGTVDFGVLFDYLRRSDTNRPLITLEPHVDEDLWPSLSYLEDHWPWESEMGTIRQQMITLLEQQSLGVRDLSQALGVSEKEVYMHLEHIQRSVSSQGRRLEMTPCECRSCGYLFKDRRRVKKPGRCPKCRQSHILGAMFRIE